VISTKGGTTSGLIRHLRQHTSLQNQYEQFEQQKKIKADETVVRRQVTLDTFVAVSEFWRENGPCFVPESNRGSKWQFLSAPPSSVSDMYSNKKRNRLEPKTVKKTSVSLEESATYQIQFLQYFWRFFC
jgi:hypothetical protein